MFDRLSRMVVVAPIVAAVLGVAAGCGGDEDPDEQAGITEALTTPGIEDSQPTVSSGDRSCKDAIPDVERGAGTNTACDEVGRLPDQQVAPPTAADATSEENAEIVRRFYDAWNRRDFADARRLVHPDFKLHFIVGYANLPGERFAGRDGLHRFMRRFAGTVGGQVTVDRTIDMGERLGVIATLKASGGLGAALRGLRLRQVWTFRAGKVIRLNSRGERSLDPGRP